MARILVVDDDQDILTFTEKVLNHSGHMTFVASDGWRALDYLNTIDFDLLISDANMPHMSGFQLVQTLRANPKFKDLLIAMLTGLRERKDIEKAVSAGVDDYIVKPLDPLILLQKIESLFKKRPPESHPEIPLERFPHLSTGKLYTKMDLLSVSELGLRVISHHPIQEGQILDIDCEFFTQLRVPPPPMKVLTVKSIEGTTTFEAQLMFLGARESLLQKIRAWILSHGSVNKEAA